MMLNIRLAALAAAAYAALAGSGSAEACEINGAYRYNESLVHVLVCQGALTMIYTQPHSGVAAQGARPGTLLVNGTWHSDTNIVGTARMFTDRCGQVSYQVAGRRQGNTIVLSGKAPVHNINCKILRLQVDRLLFTPAGGDGGPDPAPRPSHGGSASWHAIGGTFRKQAQAEARAQQLGAGWRAMNTADCRNFRKGYWIATAGPFDKQQALSFKKGASDVGAYVKTCRQ